MVNSVMSRWPSQPPIILQFIICFYVRQGTDPFQHTYPIWRAILNWICLWLKEHYPDASPSSFKLLTAVAHVTSLCLSLKSTSLDTPWGKATSWPTRKAARIQEANQGKRKQVQKSWWFAATCTSIHPHSRMYWFIPRMLKKVWQRLLVASRRPTLWSSLAITLVKNEPSSSSQHNAAAEHKPVTQLVNRAWSWTYTSFYPHWHLSFQKMQLNFFAGDLCTLLLVYHIKPLL